MLDNFNKWKNPEIESEEVSISALQATLNNKVSPNILPDLTRYSRSQILRAFEEISNTEIISNHISPEDRQKIIIQRESFLRTMIKLVSIEDEYKDARASLIANYLTAVEDL